MKIMRNKFIQTSIWFAFTAIIAAFPATATDTDRFSRVIENCEKRHGCIISMLAVNMRGDTIAQRNSTYSMIPASVTKTVTTALALKELGPDFRFETSIAYSGHIDSTGILHGDIYIVGGADPTLASTLPRQDSVFNIWHRAVKAAGIDSIAGSVIGDDRFFPDEAAAGSWELGDLGTYYGSGASGLSFHENYISLRITPSEHPEGRPDIEQLFPRTPWMEIENLAVTGRRKSGNSLYMLASEIEPVSQLRGSYPIDGGTSIEKCSNKYSAMTCAYHFDKYLGSHGINSAFGAMDTRRFTTRAAYGFQDRDSLTYIVTTYSAPLSYIVSKTNKESNNLYAETLFKMTGKAVSGSATYDASCKAAEKLLKGMGLETAGYKQVDGSGLSRQNLMSPAFLCRFLKTTAKAPYGKTFIESLPVPGKEGTLKYVLRETDRGQSSRIRAKSGSMSGVKCYAGYILGDTPEDMIVFAIMSNNNAGKSSGVQDTLETLMELLLGQ